LETEVVLQGTVSIWHSLDDQHLPWLLKGVNEFQSQYPHVQFDISFVPALDLETSYEIASSEGRQPMILIGPASWGPELYDQGWVADISGLASNDIIDRLNAAALGASQYANALIGLPISMEGVVLYRNPSLIFERANTLDDMISLARHANRGDVRGAWLERSFYYSGGHLSGLGGELMDSNGYPAFNDEFGIEWVNLLRTFELMGPTEFFGDNDLQAFRENRAGYLIESTAIRKSLSDAVGTTNIAIDPWPIFENGSLSGYVEAENIYLSPDALSIPGVPAWEFVETLYSADMLNSLAATGMIPAIKASAAFAPGSGISINDDLTRQAMIALEDGVTYPVVAEMDFYPPQMNIALQSIFFDNVEPEAALQSAEEAIVESVSAMQSTPTTQP
jgi:maltose-binding protein MalE